MAEETAVPSEIPQTPKSLSRNGFLYTYPRNLYALLLSCLGPLASGTFP